MILNLLKEGKFIINSLQCLFGISLSVSRSHNKITRSFSAYQGMYTSFRPKLHDFSLWNISISNVSNKNCNEKNTKQNEC